MYNLFQLLWISFEKFIKQWTVLPIIVIIAWRKFIFKNYIFFLLIYIFQILNDFLFPVFIPFLGYAVFFVSDFSANGRFFVSLVVSYCTMRFDWLTN